MQMRINQEGYCLVLSGGGAKGAYHLGVWRALSELKIPINAIIGTSIGAVLGATFAMKDEQVIAKAPQMFSINHVLNLPESFLKDGELHIAAGEFRDYREALHTIIGKRGLDTTPLKEMINTWISEAAIRESGYDFGINTINITSRKSEEVFLEQMAPGELTSYLLASSALPGFEVTKIDGNRYIDGGIYDSIPYQMARRRGYNKIIVVDISGVGIKHKFNFNGTQTVYIKNTSSLGGVLDFKKDTINGLIEFGYLDTLRCFNAIEGDTYYFRRDPDLERRFDEYREGDRAIGRLEHTLEAFYSVGKKNHTLSINDLKLERSSYDRRELMLFSDYAASILKLDRKRLYTYKELFSTLREKQKLEDVRLCEHLGTCDNKRRLERIASIEKIVKVGLDASLLKETPYFLYQLVLEILPKKAQRAVIHTLLRLYPQLPGGIYFLDLLPDEKFPRTDDLCSK